MANNGQISIVKVSIGAYGYSALNYYKIANKGQISIVKLSTGAYGYSASNYHLRIFNKGP